MPAPYVSIFKYDNFATQTVDLTARVHCFEGEKFTATVKFSADFIASVISPESVIAWGLTNDLIKDGMPEIYKDFVYNRLNKLMTSAYAETLVPTLVSNKSGGINGKPISSYAEKLPGVTSKVAYPCECSLGANNRISTLFHIIMHLNDTCGWSREQIADWIDILHDTGIINAEFQPWDETDIEQEEKQFAIGDVLTEGEFDSLKVSLAEVDFHPIIKNYFKLGETAEKVSENIQGLNLILQTTDETSELEGVNDDNED